MKAAASRFYVTGGTLRPDAPSYVERQADEDVFNGLLAGEFCYVLTSRQMGKSSLMVRTMTRLRAAGVRTVALDLSAIGQNVTPEQWYTGLLASLGDQLELEDALERVWASHSRMGWLQRWFTTVREAGLGSSTEGGSLVIFVDEIDSVLSLPFSTDEFFGAIRECYNRRPKDPELNRLAFCLMGVTTPSDLVRDKRITPFNIGRRIELNDFTQSEAAPLAAGLHPDQDTAAVLLRRVLYWTSGHPYLTQRLCQALVSESDLARPRDVDRVCQEQFFANRPRERDDNLVFVRERMLRTHPDVAGLLELYARIRSGRRVPDEETDALGSVLRLSGIVRSVNGRLVKRNRIYDHVFDRKWIRANMPDAELLRQRAAFWLGVLRTSGIAAVVILAMGFMLAITLREKKSGYISQARATLVSGYRGQRDASLNAISRAVPLFADRGAVRDMAIRALALVDLANGPTWTGRPEGTRCVALNSDFSLYARCNQEGEITVESISKSGKPVELSGSGKLAEGLWFSPDSRFLAAKLLDDPDVGVIVWALGEKREFLRVPQAVNGSALEFSPDSRRLACGHLDGTVAIYSLAGPAGRSVPELQTAMGSQRPARRLRFNRQGTKLAWCSDASAYVRIWELNGSEDRGYFYHPVRVLDLAWHPELDLLATGCKNGEIYLWNPLLPKVPKVLGRHDGEVSRLAFSHRGDLLASYGADKILALWMPFTGRQFTYRLERESLGDLLFSMDDRYLGTRQTGEELGIWKIQPGREYRVLAAAIGISEIETIDFSGNGQLLAAASNDGIIVWDAPTGQRVQFFPEVATRSALFDPRSGDLLSTGRSGFRRWRPATLSPGAPAPFEAIGSSQLGDLGQFAMSENGRVAVVFLPEIAGMRPAQLCTFEPKDRITLTPFDDEGPYSALTISSDGRLAAAEAASTNRIFVWDLERRIKVQSFWQSEKGSYFAFSPDSKWFATTAASLSQTLSESGHVQLWNTADWRLASSDAPAPSRSIEPGPLAFSRDGRLLAMADSLSRIHLLAVPDRSTVAILENPDRRQLRSLVFSPDGRSLAAACTEQLVLVWDLGLIAVELSRMGLAGSLPASIGRNVVAETLKGR